MKSEKVMRLIALLTLVFCGMVLGLSFKAIHAGGWWVRVVLEK